MLRFSSWFSRAFLKVVVLSILWRSFDDSEMDAADAAGKGGDLRTARLKAAWLSTN